MTRYGWFFLFSFVHFVPFGWSVPNGIPFQCVVKCSSVIGPTQLCTDYLYSIHHTNLISQPALFYLVNQKAATKVSSASCPLLAFVMNFFFPFLNPSRKKISPIFADHVTPLPFVALHHIIHVQNTLSLLRSCVLGMWFYHGCNVLHVSMHLVLFSPAIFFSRHFSRLLHGGRSLCFGIASLFFSFLLLRIVLIPVPVRVEVHVHVHVYMHSVFILFLASFFLYELHYITRVPKTFSVD